MPMSIDQSSSTNAQRLQSARFDRIAQGNGLLQRGESGAEVKDLQKALRAQGYGLHADGIFGPETERAVKSFQQKHQLHVDGLVGQETIDRLREANRPNQADRLEPTTRGSGDLRAPTDHARPSGAATTAAPTRGLSGRPAGTTQASTVDAPAGTSGGNRTAVFESLSKVGQRNQLATGHITVNGNSYEFRSGGHGKGNLPKGDYTVTPHLWSRSDRSMNVDGVGYSFALNDKYDPRVNATRSLLRIHPDGGTAGTMGCIGIVGNGDVQRRFREDMRAELNRNGGRFTLSVR